MYRYDSENNSIMQSEIYISILADLRSTSNYSDTGYDSKGIPKMASLRLFMHVHEEDREREGERVEEIEGYGEEGWRKTLRGC